MGDFGMLHCFSLPEQAMTNLRTACRISPCDAIHPNPEVLFDKSTLQLLQQAFHGQRTAIANLPDGFAMYAPERNNALLSIIKDSGLWLPKGTPCNQAPAISPDGARVVVYSVAHPPTFVKAPPRTFRLAFHDGCMRPDEISRFSLADHAIAQLAAAIPLDPTQSEGRVFMEASGLGALMAQCLVGENADLLKRTFLGLVQQAAGTGQHVFDTPIETSQTIARLLQFKSINGQLSLGRCKDGIVGYTHRRDGKYSFMFAATSDDFHAQRPAPAAKSVLHLFKMCYADPRPEAPRIFVQINNNNLNSEKKQPTKTKKKEVNQDEVNARNNLINQLLMGGQQQQPQPIADRAVLDGGVLYDDNDNNGNESAEEDEHANEGEMFFAPPGDAAAITKTLTTTTNNKKEQEDEARRSANTKTSAPMFDLTRVVFEDTHTAKSNHPDIFHNDGTLRIVPEDLTFAELISILRHIMHEMATRSVGCHEFPHAAVQNAIARAQNQEPQHPLLVAATCEMLGPRPLVVRMSP